jgi:THO complex subunit 4
MSARLDKSLDEIISTRRGSRGGKARRHVNRNGVAGKPAPTPVGGVKKNAKPAKGSVKTVPTGPSGGREGRILVSGFPKDINEPMIKEYFQKTIGPVKRVELSYGPGGVSRGIANITFVRSESAVKAVEECNGIPVDKRPIKVELLVDASLAKAIPPPKGLSERITQPKPQPKSAAVTKTNSASGTRGRRGGARGGRNPRPAKKTAEELDSEMVDYFQSGTTATETGGNAQPAANADANMDDEIL